VDILRRIKDRVPLWYLGIAALATVAFVLSSCTVTPHKPGRERTLGSAWPKGNLRWREAEYAVLQVEVPQVPDAEVVGDVEFCATCHETYTKSFLAANVHRNQSCEDCHGPASRHLETRGQEPGMILSFKTMTPEQRSEVCLKCHENAHGPGGDWRTSVHAHSGVACTDCHTNHYDVPPGTPATQVVSLSDPHAETMIARAQDAEPQESDSTASADAPVTPASLVVVRAQDAEQLPSLAGTSNNLAAVAPGICYQCHEDKRGLEEVAHPHQIGGVNCFNCTTCHNPHGNIVAATRKDNCLECHEKGSPTMAWHSSIHEQYDVACADCHNPHPRLDEQRVIEVNHTHVDRLSRLPMSVDEPFTCYKCHQKIFGMNALPSHHPIKEGKMVCSDCHDPHGQALGNLKEPSVNLVCYRCHAEKQGPFAYEHPPVTEDCTICHNPHGAVENNLLRQPNTFLCLRCHAGHRGFRRPIDTDVAGQSAFYTNCSQCHQQIHGSNLPAATRTPRFTR
jgi:DmsE family decaheme c-type cytochrome